MNSVTKNFGKRAGQLLVAGAALGATSAPLIAQTIKTANPTIPIMTLDADLKKEDAALRKTYLGTDNYLMGFKIGEYIKKAKPNGGKICTIEGNPGADNILRRASGTRDALSGQKGLDRLKGEGGLFKFRHHLPMSKPTEVSALVLAARIGRILFGEFGEIFSGDDALAERFRLRERRVVGKAEHTLDAYLEAIREGADALGNLDAVGVIGALMLKSECMA